MGKPEIPMESVQPEVVQSCSLWGTGKGYIFQDNMRNKLGNRYREFCSGLYNYLAIANLKERSGCIFSWVYLFDGTLDEARANAIRALFNASGGSGLAYWEELRTKTYEVLTVGGKAIDIIELSDADAHYYSRGGYAHVQGRNIYANARDLKDYTVVPGTVRAPTATPTTWSKAEIESSYDGFWELIHESVHITHELKEDVPVGSTTTTLGPIETPFNDIRVAFGLPTRRGYSNESARGEKPGFHMDGWDILWPVP